MADKKFNQVPLTTPQSGDLIPVLKSDGVTDGAIDAGVYLAGIITDTYSNLSTAKTGATLASGKKYFISDKDVMIIATESDQFSLQGWGRFDVPDYSVNSVWVSNSGGGSYLVNDKAIYNGSVYVNGTGTNTDTAPPSDTTNWTLVAVNETDYNEEWDYIHYDFDNDRIIWREDIRGNKVGGSSTFVSSNDPIGLFQWGNDSVTGNFVHNALMSIINQAGSFSGNSFTTGALTGTVNENFTGAFTNNQVSNLCTINLSNGTSATIQACVFDNQAVLVFNAQTNTISFCRFSKDVSATEDVGTHTDKRIQDEISTFEKVIDMSQAISDFPTATTLEITGDVTSLFENGDTIVIVGSSSNDGTYTLTAASTFGGGVTTLTAAAAGWTIEAGAGTVTGQILDIDDSYGLIGVIEIQADADVSLNKILNNTNSHNILFFPESGRTITFNHVVVASATANEITLEGGSSLALAGRANNRDNSDTVTLRKVSGSYNRQIDASILV